MLTVVGIADHRADQTVRGHQRAIGLGGRIVPYDPRDGYSPAGVRRSRAACKAVYREPDIDRPSDAVADDQARSGIGMTAT
jgi:hypothetical protein